METGNPLKAFTYFKRAEGICKKQLQIKEEEYLKKVDIANYTAVLINLAEIYNALNKTDSAALTCKEAEDSLKNNPDNRLAFKVLAEKAAICTQKKQLTQAIQLYIQSLKLAAADEATDNITIGITTNLGLLYGQTSQYFRADSIFKTVVNRLHKAGIEKSYAGLQAYIALCQNLIYQKKFLEAGDSLLVSGNLALSAIQNNFAGMTEADQLRLSGTLDVIFDMLNTVLSQKNAITESGIKKVFALDLQRKSFVLANQAALLSQMRTTNDTSIANLFTAWLTTRQLLAKQYSLTTAERYLNTDSLEALSDGIEKTISAKGVETGFKTSSEIFDKFFHQDKGFASVEFVRYNYVTRNMYTDSAVYAAFVVRGSDSLPLFVPLCSERSLLKLLHGESGNAMDEDQLTKKIYARGSKGAATLFRLVWQPLEKYLTGVTRINYSPAGLLNNISVHAINNSKGFLANSYTIRRFINLADAKNNEINEAPKAISLWGNINYDSSNNTYEPSNNTALAKADVTSLTASGIKPAMQSKSISKKPLKRFVDDEINPLTKIFSTSNIPFGVYEQTNATEENFKSQAAGIIGVLHISTHGFYTPFDKQGLDALSPGSFIAGNANPLFRCGLAFAGVNYYWMKGVPKANRDDGILTGYEAAQLDLRNVQLVTLSACETGLGDVTANEGNLGMQRAFKLAGAKNLLVSLWKVPAKQTEEMLTKFYTYWLQGNSLSTALQMAETAMQKEGFEPYYWAGFVLVE
jgi:CHAT domain-containing protein